MAKLCLILGDQLDLDISSLENFDKENDWVVMMEIKPETNYVLHHCRKMLFLFSAMRHFNQDLIEHAYKTIYIPLDAPNNLHNFVENLRSIIHEKNIDTLLVCEAGEWRLQAEITTWEESLELPVIISEDRRFFISRSDFASFAKDRKSLLMEDFYHMMRKRFAYLMDEKGPLGGKWNYDKNNRSKYDDKIKIPHRLKFEPDQPTKNVYELIKKQRGMP